MLSRSRVRIPRWVTKYCGWSGGAMVLGKLPVPGRPTYLDYSRARAYCTCGGCGWGLFGHFFSHLSFIFLLSFLSPSLWETARYRLKCSLKGPLSPNPTNQITKYFSAFTWGWSGGAMVLGERPVPKRHTNFDQYSVRAYCAYSRCGWGCLDIFPLVYHFSFLSSSL